MELTNSQTKCLLVIMMISNHQEQEKKSQDLIDLRYGGQSSQSATVVRKMATWGSPKLVFIY